MRRFEVQRDYSAAVTDHQASKSPSGRAGVLERDVRSDNIAIRVDSPKLREYGLRRIDDREVPVPQHKAVIPPKLGRQAKLGRKWRLEGADDITIGIDSENR